MSFEYRTFAFKARNLITYLMLTNFRTMIKYLRKQNQMRMMMMTMSDEEDEDEEEEEEDDDDDEEDTDDMINKEMAASG